MWIRGGITLFVPLASFNDGCLFFEVLVQGRWDLKGGESALKGWMGSLGYSSGSLKTRRLDASVAMFVYGWLGALGSGAFWVCRSL